MKLISWLASKCTRLQTLLKSERDLASVRGQLNELEKRAGLYPLGHFYSPIPNWEEVRKDEPIIWAEKPAAIDGIELNQENQLALLEKFRGYYAELPFSAEKQDGFRYFYENPSYSYSDAIILFSMIRHICPKRIIEVGSGYSSCLMLDTNERFFENRIHTTFIDPYPQLLYDLIKEDDQENVHILPGRIQDIPIQEFVPLERNDILFIDSTHVSKVNSDVNHIFFKILPALKSGVYIHFHDIFYPFEYPKTWTFEGRAWNENYMLRAFLEYNHSFKIIFFNTYLEHFYEDWFKENMPLCLKNKGGSIWIQKQ